MFIDLGWTVRGVTCECFLHGGEEYHHSSDNPSFLLQPYCFSEFLILKSIFAGRESQNTTGNPEEHSILEFAQLIKKLVGSGSEIQFLSEAQDDPQKRKPDIKKAKLLLGWEPVVGTPE
ncbi:UDP-glucuronic acid decarboxylase 1 [Varanus komodoensis]|nr:UDP-glucuronic acid decarboxylase 1 [Varanus komodoensis]